MSLPGHAADRARQTLAASVSIASHLFVATLVRERRSHFVEGGRMRFKQPFERRDCTLDATARTGWERFTPLLNTAGMMLTEKADDNGSLLQILERLRAVVRAQLGDEHPCARQTGWRQARAPALHDTPAAAARRHRDTDDFVMVLEGSSWRDDHVQQLFYKLPRLTETGGIRSFSKTTDSLRSVRHTRFQTGAISRIDST